MELDTYYKLISSEARTPKYLLGKCFKNHQRFCPRCRCRKLYKLREGRYRCSRCEYTFQDFSGRWINRGRLSALQWLSLIKLFELEVSVRKMSLQLGLSYRAVYGVVSTIRMAILSHAEDASTLLGGEIELDEAYFGGRRKGYASNDGEWVQGLRAIGVPVYNGRGEVEASLNVTFISQLVSFDEMIYKYVQPLMATAGRISAALGFDGHIRYLR